MVYTLGEAAKSTGKSKATISKAIKSGRLSAEKGENGAYRIDPSELHRVYPPTPTVNSKLEHSETLTDSSEYTSKIRELEVLLNAANQRLEDRSEQISDLKTDRDKWRQQATSLLEDKRPRNFLSQIFMRK